MFTCLVLFFYPFEKIKTVGNHRGDFSLSLCICYRETEQVFFFAVVIIGDIWCAIYNIQISKIGIKLVLTCYYSNDVFSN